MRIGYCSPLNPSKSGISDFSEELVQALKDYVDITLFSPAEPDNAEIRRAFPWHPISDLDKASVRRDLDLIVYHVGNNDAFHGEIIDMLLKYPGVLELHDIGIHNMMAARTLEKQGREAYTAMVEYCHGKAGLAAVTPYLNGEADMPWETYGLELTMNRMLVDKSLAVIVHSDQAKQILLADRPKMPVQVIPHHSILCREPLDEFQQRCRKELDLPQDKLIFGSFGFASPDKRIEPIIQSLQRFKQTYGDDFLYCIVGKVSEQLKLPETLQSLGLEEQVHITGFVTLEDFSKYMGACDFCLNLRYPTRGESSGSLHRMLGMGKPVIVTKIGSFIEYPDDIVRKVRYNEHEVDDITEALLSLAQEKDRFGALRQRVFQYAGEHFSLETNALRYKRFFEQVLNHTWLPDWTDLLVDRLMELRLTNPEYTAHVSEFLREEWS